MSQKKMVQRDLLKDTIMQMNMVVKGIEIKEAIGDVCKRWRENKGREKEKRVRRKK